MCVASPDPGCALGTPVASSPCTPSTMAAWAAHPLVAPPSAPPAATQWHGSPSADMRRTRKSASSCAAGGFSGCAARPCSQRCSPSLHSTSSGGRRLFAQQLGDGNELLVGQHAEGCEADAPGARAGPWACAHVPRSAYSSPAGGSSRRLAVHELPVKRRTDDCAATGPYEYAPRPRSAHCSPSGGSGRHLYARAREQSRRNEIQCASHMEFLTQKGRAANSGRPPA